METKDLSNEKRLVILLSRLTLSDSEVLEIKQLVDSELNWIDVLSCLIINKTVGLAYFNLSKLSLLKKIHNLTYQIMKYTYLANQIKTKRFLEEKERILASLKKENVNIFPVKGAQLVGDIYEDLGIRSMNDIDFFVDIEDFKKISEVLTFLSYKQGEYDRDDNQIISFSREKELVWKTKMSNNIPYIYKCENEFMDEVAIDLSAYYNLDRNIEVSKEVLLRAKDDKLDEYDQYLYLVAHLYKEATGIIWIIHNSDINLIKFCDVREYLLNKKLSTHLIVERAIRYNLSNSLYFTVFYLKELFGDGYEDEILDSLISRNCVDIDVINSFGTDIASDNMHWKNSFYDRLFSYSNSEILKKNIKDRYDYYEKL